MGKRIVYIDQCAATRSLVSQALEAAGYSVGVADCCVYANDLIYGSVRPDLIMLDVLLPMMRGDKKTQLLKAREKSQGIPVLLTAALAEDELRALAASAGADGYLLKPFDDRQLLATVASFLDA